MLHLPMQLTDQVQYVNYFIPFLNSNIWRCIVIMRNVCSVGYVVVDLVFKELHVIM